LSQPKPYLSVVVPLYNEEANVELLVERIAGVCGRLAYPTEIILVDDGSVDATVPRARALVARNPDLKLVIFRRNFGQTAAMVAGLQEARGEVLVTMDGDLQNDPEDIPRLVAGIQSGYSLVLGWRADRKDKLITRKIPSRVANWLIAKVTGVPVRDNGCSLKAYRSELIKRVPLYSEMHRFIPAMTSMVSHNFSEIEVGHHARVHGESKYGLSRTYKVAVDLIAVKALLVASRSPLMFFAIPAAIAALVALPLIVASIADASLVLLGAGLLWGAGSLVSLSFGILAALLIDTGRVPGSELSALTGVRRGWDPA
jgi:glycosyltransferase involved in cell wall biosynthesis